MSVETIGKDSAQIELTVFTVGDILCAVENDRVREISGLRAITPVHHAPEHVRGVVNLRGQIMTIIDLGVRLGIGAVPEDRNSRILVVRSGEEDIGLLVDGIEDVKTVSASDMEPPPSNVQGLSGAFLKAILKEKDDLACIVDMEKILHID
ncbi:MAG: purine-binding chemotaxis protein CheW [Fibrobacterota bacterium]|nr:purine-binding chemotaxis protein CheW [Fibrobacterota bacterium]QQS07287.1 MAG: purine-binding chemotaxis protein CheW [Fibrobacterota bacterium]